MITDSLMISNLRLLGISHSDYSVGHDAADELERLDGENAVLRGLLNKCAAVLRVIEADDCAEAESFADLLAAIDRAQSPDNHKGSLL